MPEVRFVGPAAIVARGVEVLEAAMRQSAETLASSAQSKAPVRTGTLRASIHVDGVQTEGNGVTATVKTGGEASEYAVFQELGTSKMAAQPFMTPAVAEHRALHEKIGQAAWKKAF